jgi:hypothetical protein
MTSFRASRDPGGQPTPPAMLIKVAGGSPSLNLVTPTSPMGSGASSQSPQLAAPAPRLEMLDIEANLVVEVASVGDGAAELRSLARSFEGLVVEDTVRETAGSASARLTARVPSARASAFVDAIAKVGRLRSREMSARDVGKEFFDAELRLQNLQTTMGRFEEILKLAKDVSEVLRVENELSRLRAEIEQTKGNLRWLGDRAARATVHVDLVSPKRAVASEAIALDPQAKVYPGLRLAWLTDLAGPRGTGSYFGGGIAVGMGRSLALRLDGFRETGTGSPTEGLDVVLLTLGGETYSDFLGAGKRAFFNPYLGWSAGYARFVGTDQALAGVTLGVEIWKSKGISLDADLRSMVVFLGPRRAHVTLEPSLAATVPF